MYVYICEHVSCTTVPHTGTSVLDLLVSTTMIKFVLSFTFTYILYVYSVNTHRPSIIFLLYTQYYLYPDTCGYPCTCTDCFWVTATFFHFLDFLVFGFLIVYVNHECMSCMCTYSTYIWSFTYIHVYIHKHIYVHLYVPVCMYVYMYIHIHTYIHVYR